MVMLCPPVMEPLRLFPLPVQPEVHPADESLSPAGADIPALTVLWPIHTGAGQKPTQYSEAIALQLTVNKGGMI